MESKLSKREVYIGVGALVVFALSAWVLYTTDAPQDGSAGTNAWQAAGDSSPPPMTAVMEQVLERSRGFQLLVSYSAEGFAPSHASIKAGDTVRFTNNSQKELWVSAAAVHGGHIYPGSQASCGQSNFDSCVRLKPYEFWEFTFEEAGTWGYINVAEPSHEAALEVI